MGNGRDSVRRARGPRRWRTTLVVPVLVVLLGSLVGPDRAGAAVGDGTVAGALTGASAGDGVVVWQDGTEPGTFVIVASA